MSMMANFPAPAQQRNCRVCGCTDHHACVDELGTPCFWVGHDLCSNCLISRQVALSPEVDLSGRPAETFDDVGPIIELATDADLNILIAEHRRIFGGVHVG